MAGPTNQLDWGQLLGMYSQAADAAQPGLQQKQAADAEAQRKAIQQALGGIESNVYANVGKGVAGDVTQAPGYSGLIDQYNAHEAQRYANQVEGAAWETLFKNPAKSTGPQQADPWDSVKQRLDAMQSNANQQAQWNLGQQQWQQDQANRAKDDNVSGAGFRAAWDKWVAGGGKVQNMDSGRLTSNMERSQQQWRDTHGGSLEGWYTSLPGVYYSRAMGGYNPQTYNSVAPAGGYSGGFAGSGSFNPNSTNQLTAKPDDEAQY